MVEKNATVDALEAGTPESGFVCCNQKFNNCPRASRENGRVVLVGDDGARIEFEDSQFEVLLARGPELLR